jgi:hypothetical protein
VSRIFLVLAIISIGLLCAAAALGLYVGEYNELYTSLMQSEQQLHALRLQGETQQTESLEQQIDQTYRQLELPRRRATFHMLVGILASLVAVLVNSISVTYFIGTSRWCKEVVATYQLDPTLAVESARLKRRSFPWALGGILLVLTIVAFGAASDPGTLRESTGRWVLPHFTAALGGGALIASSFLIQAGMIHRNTRIVEQILEQVRQIRLQRGLDVEG